ncbi:hypothetical protein D9M72_585280 [compost metagenome]
MKGLSFSFGVYRATGIFQPIVLIAVSSPLSRPTLSRLAKVSARSDFDLISRMVTSTGHFLMPRHKLPFASRSWAMACSNSPL